jgi:DUF1680 family protein
VEERQGPETCNTYNMLKLTGALHRADPRATYADYYERALFNHILASQHPGHGGYVYFTPVRPRHYRVYSAPNEAMWCCVGSGMENHGKYGEFIYSHRGDTLYVNLFIASELEWKSKGARVRQTTRFPEEPRTTLTVLTADPVEFTLKLRHPAWVPAGELGIRVGSAELNSSSEPSTYVEVRRTWRNGDRIEVSLPMRTAIEELPNVPEYIAFLHGPIVLAARTGREDLKGLVADDSRWGHIAGGALLPLEEAPVLLGSQSGLASALKPAGEGTALRFRAPGLIRPEEYGDLVLEPFYRIHDSRYVMYWRVSGAGE